MTSETSEYTKKCLKELQEQMNQEREDIVISDEEYENNDIQEEEPNLLIQSFFSKKPKRDNDIVPVLLAQRELDRNKMEKLSNRIFEIQMEYEKSDIKHHYSKLELNNSQIKCDELTSKLLQTKKEHKIDIVKIKENNWQKICGFAVLLYFSVFLNICQIFYYQN